MKLLSFCLLTATVLFISSVNGQTMQGPFSPNKVTEQYLGCLACPGTSWTNLNNVKKSDSLFATTQLAGNPKCIQGACYYARQIIATNFGFTIPSNAIITGIKADVQRLAGTANIIYDSAVYLYENNIRLGNNKASSTTWPVTDTYVSYGDSTDQWSAALTPADINDTTFGITLKPFNSDTTGFIATDVDHIQLSVYYKIPTSIETRTTINSVNVSYAGGKILVHFATAAPEKTISLCVFNSTGQRVYLKEFNSKQATISESIGTQEFPVGLYIVSISGWDETISRKVIIR